MMQKQHRTEDKLTQFIRFGLYLTAFIPLIIFREFISPFHFGKVIIFRSLIEILGAAYLVLVLKNKSYLPRTDKIFWAFLIFTSVFTITVVTSSLRYLSFWGTLERMGGLWTFWHYFLYFIILTSVFNKKIYWQRLFDLIIFAGVLSAFYGFGQKTNLEFILGSGGRERIFGTIGNAALFAGYELFSVFISLTMFFKPSNTQNHKTLYLSAFIIASIAVLTTAVRGSILGYGVGLMIFAFLWTKQNKSPIGKFILAGLVGLAILFTVFSFLFQESHFIKNSRYLSRITDISNSLTIQTRIWAWQAGLDGWNDSLKTIILGYGPEAFNVPFSKYFNPKFYISFSAETYFDRAHNVFIDTLVTMGIIGLAAYINIFVALFAYLRSLLKSVNFAQYGIGFVPLLIAYIIHDSFILDTIPNFLILFAIMGFVSFNNALSKEKEAVFERKSIASKYLLNMITAVLVIFVPILIYKTNVLPAKANYATTRAITKTWQGDFNGAFEKFKEALSYDGPGKYEYRHRFAQYLIGPKGPSVREEKVRQAFEIALAGIDKNIKENQIDYLPYLYGSRLNILLARDDPKSPYNDKALGYATKALEISPTFLRTYYEIGQAYVNKKDYTTAIRYFQKAVDLNPETGVSYWYLGGAKLESGDLGGTNDIEKSSLAANPFRPNEKEYLKLVEVYLKLNNFTEIANIYEQLVSLNANPQYFALLATAYAKVGKFDEADMATRIAVKIDPSFENDARIFLRSIGRKPNFDTDENEIKAFLEAIGRD